MIFSSPLEMLTASEYIRALCGHSGIPLDLLRAESTLDSGKDRMMNEV